MCNSIENDPDIQHMPICAVTPEVWSKPYWSTYYEKWVAMDSFGHWAVSHQDRLYLLVMSLARFNLYVQSVAHLLSKNAMHYRKTELIAFIVYFSWLSAVVLSQKYVIVGVLWLLISHATSGLLHVQITTSHWAMETYHGRAYNDEKDEWQSLGACMGPASFIQGRTAGAGQIAPKSDMGSLETLQGIRPP